MKKENGNFKLIGGFVAGILIGSVSIVCANQAIQAIQNTEIKVSLNGQVQTFKDETTGEAQYPITYHDRTYLPLRNVANLSGLGVDYDANTKTAVLMNDIIKEVISQAEKTIKYPLNNNDSYIEAKSCKVRDIIIYDYDYIDTFVKSIDSKQGEFEYLSNKEKMQSDYNLFKALLKKYTRETLPIMGHITFMIEYGKPVSAEGRWVGNGPDFLYGNYAIGSREFVYNNGEFSTNTGGTFTFSIEEESVKEKIPGKYTSLDGSYLLFIGEPTSPDNEFGLRIKKSNEENYMFTTGEKDIEIDEENNIIVFPKHYEGAPFKTDTVKKISYRLNNEKYEFDVEFSNGSKVTFK